LQKLNILIQKFLG